MLSGLSTHKNNRLLYLLRGLLKALTPAWFHNRRLMRRYHNASFEERYTLRQRCDYYCGLSHTFQPEADAPSITQFLRRPDCRSKTNYFLDLYEYLRHFPHALRFHFHFGDEYAVPARPTLIKARPISLHNRNSVLMKLNKVRHFNFVRDNMPFEDKMDMLVWRGNARKPHRRAVLEKIHALPGVDAGDTGKHSQAVPWGKPFMSIAGQLSYKFILSIEGNDVATNLKWIMSSNSLCFMTRPTRETWFMEGRLVANYHYVLLRDDYSDLEEKMDFYTQNPEQALRIIHNAQRYVSQFRDSDREDLIALMVMDRYFRLSGQLHTQSPGPALT